VAALDALGLAAADLRLVAEHHADEGLRRQAAVTWDRLRAAGEKVAAPAGGGLHSCHLTAVDGDGGQLAVLACESATDPEALDVLSVYYTDRDGVQEYATAELLSEDELDDLLAGFMAEGVLPFEVAAGAAAARLHQATALTLASGGAKAVGYAVWPSLVGPVPPVEPRLSGDGGAPLSETARLLDHPAFALWFFDPDDVLLASPGPDAAPAAVAARLVDAAAADRLASRLRHQAWLLAAAGDDESAALALAAAAGLEPGAGVPPGRHPLLVSMVARSPEPDGD
jgi:hypothetical protein